MDLYNRMPAVTYSAAQGTVQTIQQALQAQVQDMQLYHPSVQYYYPTYVTQNGIYFSTIPYGTVYNL
ncbi:DUF3947 family protein [Bacillus gaemokensis]|uniref:Uncharacterized protein n=1 Tax=Bacillus gaemokensis TaxID=574375 RepID=A0A073KBX6_9BACI|nr:DUF3947 family protein [Bacillus gaemokensis]KEK24021.1 hypothetical protein BAGA_04735 [Bacillus gaemokensis]KYG27225.1 hypothetical protein AZF08_15885 [Bacillus gaemokensis]